MTSAAAPYRSLFARAEPQALTAEKLAAFVDRATARSDAMLFTTTPREELDEIGRFQQLKDQAWVGQVRAIVAAYNRASEAEREFAGDEVALAIGAAPGTGSRLVAQALSVAGLPGLLEAVSAGLLTERHVNSVLRELDLVVLSTEQRHAIVLVLLARYAGQTPAELGKDVRRLILTVDRAAAQARQDTANGQRRVRFYSDVDGQAVLHARGPVARIAAIKAALERTLPTAPVDGDERCHDEREFDLLVALLTGTTEPAGWHAHVVIPYRTALGGDLELAEVPGFGPILPSTAQDLLDSVLDLTQLSVDQTGTVLGVGTPVPAPAAPAAAECPVRAALRALATTPAQGPAGSAHYRAPKRLQRFLEARDKTCVFPGCHRPAQTTDKDHRTPWPAGPTSAQNLQCLCRHHHRAKQTVFGVELTVDGDYLWTTRGHWQFLRRRLGY